MGTGLTPIFACNGAVINPPDQEAVFRGIVGSGLGAIAIAPFTDTGPCQHRTA